MSSSRFTPTARDGGAFSVHIVDEDPGMMVLQAQGDAEAIFANESGAHRWMRIPPGEPLGRVHTSIVAVTVLHEPSERDVSIHTSDLEWLTPGSGVETEAPDGRSGEAHVRHKPSGVEARCRSTTSQPRTRALAVLRARIWARQNAARHAEAAAIKRRTVRLPIGDVVDHVTGQRWEATRYLSGDW